MAKLKLFGLACWLGRVFPSARRVYPEAMAAHPSGLRNAKLCSISGRILMVYPSVKSAALLTKVSKPESKYSSNGIARQMEMKNAKTTVD